jgi:hypothetical protein
MKNEKPPVSEGLFKAQIELPRALWKGIKVEATKIEKTARECVEEALTDWVLKVKGK